MSSSWRTHKISNSRFQDKSFESFDLEEYTQEEEDDQRRARLRTTFRAAAFEAREKQSQSSYFEDLLRKGLTETQASYATYGARYAFRRMGYDEVVGLESCERV